MRALFHVGAPIGWGTSLGHAPWCLAPVAGKPLLEYWLEWASELGIHEITIVLGDGAYEIESFCGDGSRWGVECRFGFQKEIDPPADYLRRSPHKWREGLLFINGPVFPVRLSDSTFPEPSVGSTFMLSGANGPACLLSAESAALDAWLSGGNPPEATAEWSALGLDPLILSDIQAYYTLNMRMVAGEQERYVQSGYGGRDGVQIGYNVQIPPSVELHPPLTIGNDCRFHPMSVIGPNAVIGNRVIIDRQTEVSDSILLDGTYLGCNLEISGKIISGNRIIDPAADVCIDVADPWLAAALTQRLRATDLLRAGVGWLIAFALIILQAVPFALLYPFVRSSGGTFRTSNRLLMRNRERSVFLFSAPAPGTIATRFFQGLSLDLFPLFLQVVGGRLWLCGHQPLHPERDAELRQQVRRYYPAAISFQTRRPDHYDPAIAMAEAFYYERHASLKVDLALLARTLFGRLLDALTQDETSQAMS